MKRIAWKSSAGFAAVLAALSLSGTPAQAQSSVYNFPVGGSTQDVLNWYSGFNSWLSQMKDLSSLGIPNYSGGLNAGVPGTTGNTLAFANTLSRQVGKVTNLRTIGNPRAEAEVAAIVRRWHYLGQIERGRAAEQQVRNGVQQYDLRTYYQNVASQARRDRQWALDAGRTAALQKDYNNAIAYAALASYFGRVANDYGQR